MKNILKIAGLTVALLTAVMIVNTNAQSSDMNLEITSGTGGCYVPPTLDFGQIASSYTATTGSASFANQSVYCEDLNGSSATWTFSIQSSNLTSSNGKSIANTLISATNTNTTVVSGSCALGGDATNGDTLNQARALFTKNNDQGAICTVATDLNIQISIPESQAVGIYTGTLTFTNNGTL